MYNKNYEHHTPHDSKRGNARLFAPNPYGWNIWPLLPAGLSS